MPNWNQNTVTFSNSDAAQIAKIKTIIDNEQSIMRTFVPLNSDEYDSALDAWGTKWSDSDVFVLEETPNSIKVSFDTAWCPPINFYNAMERLGFEIQAYYMEPGIGFVGKYSTEDGDNEYELVMNPEVIQETIPQDIIDEFNLVEYATEYAEEYDDAA